MNNAKFSLDFYPVRRRTVFGESGGAQQILFNSETEKYFLLDEVGALIWGLCDGATCVSQMINQLLAEYEVPVDVAQFDLMNLLGQFVEHKLLVRDS